MLEADQNFVTSAMRLSRCRQEWSIHFSYCLDKGLALARKTRKRNTIQTYT